MIQVRAFDAQTGAREEVADSIVAAFLASVRARAASPHRALVNRAALRLGHPASIPRAETAELLAGGTRERGSPSAIAITAPFPGAAFNRSRRCTRTRVPLRVAMLTLSGCHFSGAMRHWRTPDQGLRP